MFNLSKSKNATKTPNQKAAEKSIINAREYADTFTENMSFLSEFYSKLEVYREMGIRKEYSYDTTLTTQPINVFGDYYVFQMLFGEDSKTPKAVMILEDKSNEAK